MMTAFLYKWTNKDKGSKKSYKGGTPIHIRGALLYNGLIDKLGLRVIVCPDRDKAGIELIDQALALGWEVSFPQWHVDCKDAADAVSKYGRLATVYSIMHSATGNKIKAQVKAKLINTDTGKI